MKRLSPLLLLLVGGCLLRPTWHWEKAGAGDDQYRSELNQCKALTYPGADGMVTNESIRRMHLCMESRGWRRVEN